MFSPRLIEQRTFKLIRPLGMILAGMFSSTVLYNSVIAIMEEGLSHLHLGEHMTFSVWAALSVWLANYVWGCTTEWQWCRYYPLQGIRCVVVWMMVMVANIIWPPALGFMTYFWFSAFSALGNDFGSWVTGAVGIGCLVYNFFHPQRALEKIENGTYSVS